MKPQLPCASLELCKREARKWRKSKKDTISSGMATWVLILDYENKEYQKKLNDLEKRYDELEDHINQVLF